MSDFSRRASGLAKRTAYREQSSDEQLLALINVVFLLLIFVLINATFIPQPPFAVELPISQSADEASNQPLTIALGADGQLAWNGRQISSDALIEALRGQSLSAEAGVQLHAHSAVPATTVLKLANQIEQADLGRIDVILRVRQ
jgi:biopolymer transport protein ExbD